LRTDRSEKYEETKKESPSAPNESPSAPNESPSAPNESPSAPNESPSIKVNRDNTEFVVVTTE